MDEKRQIVTYYLPTKKWLSRQAPKGKQEILTWYRRNKAVLETRRLRKVFVEMEVVAVSADRNTKEILKKAKQPRMLKIEKHRISQQDYLVYLRLLDEKFKRFKQEHNQRVRDEKRTKQSS